MPRKPTPFVLPPSHQAPAPAPARPRARPFRVLVVDPQPQFGQLLEQCRDPREPMQIDRVDTLAQARARLTEGPVDLVVIEPDLPDGSGLELASEIHKRRRRTQTIVISEKPSLDAAVQAIRAGASDFFIKPLDLKAIDQRVRQVMHARRHDQEQTQRVRRLRRACKKLNQARIDVSRQVDILCNDLVTAYQELACQMQQVVSTREYGVLIRNELDLEQLIRKTLEFIVEKVGPTNAAIFLPATADEFSLGGYINYDCTSESADLLLQHLGDVVAPKLTACDKPVHLTDNPALEQWIGNDAVYLADRHVLGFACQHEREPLAALVMFRDADQPFDAAAVEACTGIAPLLGDALIRIIRIHHRHLADGPFAEDR